MRYLGTVTIGTGPAANVNDAGNYVASDGTQYPVSKQPYLSGGVLEVNFDPTQPIAGTGPSNPNASTDGTGARPAAVGLATSFGDAAAQKMPPVIAGICILVLVAVAAEVLTVGAAVLLLSGLLGLDLLISGALGTAQAVENGFTTT